MEDKGWTDLIDRKFREEVINDLQKIDGITEKEINEIMKDDKENE